MYTERLKVINYRTIGKRLKRIREEKGYSLYDVERLSKGEFKVPTLSSYETAKRKISISRLNRLASLYEVTLDSILGAERIAEENRPYGKSLIKDLRELEEKIRKTIEKLEEKE